MRYPPIHCPVSGKGMYVARRDAKAEAKKRCREHGVQLRVYLCEHCRHWYMTSGKSEMDWKNRVVREVDAHPATA